MASGDLVIGVDGGGTKTVAVLADASGREVARALGAGTNLQTVGAAVVRDRLSGLFEAILGGVTGAATVRAVAVALAGVDRPADIPVATTAILDGITAARMRSPGVSWSLPSGLPTVVNDAVAALAAGAETLDGVVVIAGTGSIAFGTCRGVRARAGGWGSILGDEGSGYALGYHALRAVARAHDGRAPETGLTGAILARLGVPSAPDLIATVSAPGWGVAETAGLAPVVVKAAENGDPVAVALVDEAAAELALAAVAVIDALPFDPDHHLPVVQAGGLWGASARLREQFAARLGQRTANARPAVLTAEPVLGAVWIARRDAGLLDGARP